MPSEIDLKLHNPENLNSPKFYGDTFTEFSEDLDLLIGAAKTLANNPTEETRAELHLKKLIALRSFNTILTILQLQNCPPEK